VIRFLAPIPNLSAGRSLRRLAVHVGLAAGLLLPLTACRSDADPAAEAADVSSDDSTDDSTDDSSVDSPDTPVVLDYSPTVSDAGALLYLAARSDVDLLAVTLPSTGEAECEPGVRITRALLTIAGRADVPVGCGRPVPAAGRNEWPAEWRTAANHLPGVVLPGVRAVDPLDATDLLADVLSGSDEAVTIVAVAPLTNLAALLADRPDLSTRIDRIVTMGGAVGVPGNVEAAPAAEWNFYVDPAATREVLGSGVDTLVVPLDATNDVPWTRALIGRIATSTHPVARAEHQVVTSHPSLDGIYLWDELAAVAALEPGVVTTEPMTLMVDEVGALAVDPTGAPATVAITADVEAATGELLRSLNGGQPLVFDDLTDEEAAYFQTLSGTMAELAREFEDLEEPTAPAAPSELAQLLVATMWGVLDGISSQLDELTPPDAVADQHAAFADTVTSVIAMEDELLEAIDRAEGDDPWMILESAINQVGADPVDGLLTSCQALEAHALVRGGPDLCELFSE
jgi:inosine-uridine nucleoside N-ribohydrolase